MTETSEYFPVWAAVDRVVLHTLQHVEFSDYAEEEEWPDLIGVRTIFSAN